MLNRLKVLVYIALAILAITYCTGVLSALGLGSPTPF